MGLGMSPRAWFGAASWHLRGIFASEANRRVGFRARELFQPAEIEARRGLARVLESELLPELRIADGYKLLDQVAMPDLGEVCENGRAILHDASLEVGVANGDKKFSRYRLAKEAQRLALLRVAMDRRLLAMASAKLGVLPVIIEADYFCSFPVAGPFTKSQLWHCDDDAGDVLKIFIYCDDVETADGPFELIEPNASQRARAAVGYRYAGRRYRVSDEAMSRQVPDRDIVSLVGPRGTAFAVDTVHCFHRGSRITKENHARVVGMICYCPPNGTSLPRRLASGKAPLVEFSSHFPGEIESAVLGNAVATKWI
jgi:hypothetical protein